MSTGDIMERSPAPLRCTAATVTINGRPVQGIESLSYTPAPPARVYAGCDFAAGASWSATFTIRTDRCFKGRGREAYQHRLAYRIFGGPR